MKPFRGPGGVVYSSGLGVRPRPEERRFRVEDGPFRAVVVDTFVQGDPDNGVDASENAGPRITQFHVTADVILVRSGAILRRVPVMPRRWGVNDAEPWVPRKTTRTLSNNEPLNLESAMSFRGDAQGGVTSLSDVDGDIVLVDFVENDIHFPIIRDVYPHPQSLRPIVEGSGWAEAEAGSERGTPHDQEHYFRFAGFEMRVNDDGDVLLDTVGATNDHVNEDPSSGGGQLRIRVKNAERFTVEMDGTDVLEVWKDGAQVRVDLGEGADERIVLGDSLMSFINDELVTKLNTFWTTIFNTHTHTLPMGTTGTPTPTQVETAASFTTALLSDLAKTKKT